MKAAFLSSSLIVPKGTAAPSVLATVRPGYRDHVSDKTEVNDVSLSRRVLSRVSAPSSDEDTWAEEEDVGEAGAEAAQTSALANDSDSAGAVPPDTPCVDGSTPCADLSGEKDNFTADADDFAARLPNLDRTGRVKLSLRLTPERHLRLKLVAAHRRQSVQKLMLEALDAHIQSLAPGVMHGECACLDSMIREQAKVSAHDAGDDRQHDDASPCS